MPNTPFAPSQGKQRYIGTKRIFAAPMSRADYNDYRGWEPPEDERGEDEGMLVEYVDGGASNHPNHVGYISWSPLDVFNKSYRNIEKGMTFGDAIDCLKCGKKVARRGWNGKGMFLYYVPEGSYPPGTDVAKETFGQTVPYEAYIAMKHVGNKVVPWLASQTDMLAEDWVVVE